MSTAVNGSLNYREIIQPKAQFRLYNPAPIPVERDFAAQTYVIPAQGELAIYGLGASHTNTRGEGLPKGSASWRDAVPAEVIVAHFIGEDGRSGALGPLGVRCLFGDERDVEVRAEAAEAWKLWEYKSDLKEEAAHNKAVQNAKENGIPLPVATIRTREAIRRRAEFEKETAVIASHPCQCGYPCFSADELNSHTLSTHNRASAQPEGNSSAEVDVLKAQIAALTAAVQTMAAVQGAKARRGRPKKSTEEAA